MEPAPNDSWSEAFRQRLSGYEPEEPEAFDDRFFWQAISQQEEPKPIIPGWQRFTRAGLLAGLLLLAGLTTWWKMNLDPEEASANTGRSGLAPSVAGSRGIAERPSAPRHGLAHSSRITKPVTTSGKSGISPASSPQAGTIYSTGRPRRESADGVLSSASFRNSRHTRRNRRNLAQQVRGQSRKETTLFSDNTGLARRSEGTYTAGSPLRMVNQAPVLLVSLQPRPARLGRALRLYRPIAIPHQPTRPRIQRSGPVLYSRLTPLASFFSFRPDRTDEGVIEGVGLSQPNGRMGWQWESGVLLDMPQRQQLRLGLIYQTSSPTLLVRHQTGTYFAPTLDGPARAETATDTVSLRNHQLGLSAQWLVPLVIGRKADWYGIGGLSAAKALQRGGRTQLSGTFGLGHNRVITADGRMRLLVEATLQRGLLMQPSAQLPALSYTAYQTGLSVGLVYQLK